MLADKNVEAVFIATSWEEHVDMAIVSMKAGKYTAVEVAGAYDVEDCWRLVRTYEETKTPIMMMKNCCFDRFEMLSTSPRKRFASTLIVQRTIKNIYLLNGET